jgi:signal transduction histidine kinase
MKRRSATDGRRIDELLDLIARMAGGDLAARAPISPRRDAIDALAFGLNLLGGELGYTLDRLRRSRTEAERANAAKEVFLRNVTHELRTPLAAILLVSEALGRPGTSDERRRHLAERIERNAQALLRMIDHLLDLTRVQTERLDLNVEAIAPAEAIREVVELLELDAHAKGIGLRAVVSRTAHRVLYTDAIRLRQILLNVIGNAIKYTEAGRVEIRLDRAIHLASPVAQIDVRDTGVGIAAEDQPRLFEPFSRGRTTSDQFPGNGLGLALSRGLARALSGDLALVRSAEGKGSTFRLTLPAPSR